MSAFNKKSHIVTMLIVLLLFFGCSRNNTETKKDDFKENDLVSAEQKGSTAVTYIKNEEHFNRTVENAGDRLLLFDLYADWCGPCRALSPILEEIAKEKSNIVSLYKIDVDAQKGIARKFNVTSIPLVIFIKNKAVVKALMGVQPKATYLEVISQFAP